MPVVRKLLNCEYINEVLGTRKGGEAVKIIWEEWIGCKGSRRDQNELTHQRKAVHWSVPQSINVYMSIRLSVLGLNKICSSCPYFPHRES